MWNISSCIFIFHNAHIPKQSNSTMAINSTMCEMNDNCTQIHFDSWYLVAMYVMWLILTFKEFVEIKMCPDISFYKKQFENIGQWAIIIIDLIVFGAVILIHKVDLSEEVVLAVFKLQPLLLFAYLVSLVH